MSTPEASSPESDGAAPGRRGPSSPLIAAGIVALVVVIVAATIVPRIVGVGASRGSTSTTLCCSPQKAASQALSLSMRDDGYSLDPVVASGDFAGTAQQLAHLLFDGLVTLDDANKVELWGADRVVVSSDGLTYTFHLRDYQFFSDGAHVEPSDYAWSLDRALNPCVWADQGLGSADQSPLTVIKDGDAFASENCASDQVTVDGKITTLIGDSIVPDNSLETLTITLQHPAGYFLAALALLTASVVDRRAMNGLGLDGAWTANLTAGPTGMGGSGMFYIAARDQKGDLTLKPNPHWWGRSAGKLPNFTELDVHLYADTALDYSSFLASPYDYLSAAPSDTMNTSESRPDYHVVPELVVSSISFNWNLPPFNNVDARQALCLALNRDTIVQQVLQNGLINRGVVPLLPSWHLVPQGMPGYNARLTGIDGVTATSGDLAKAEAHWQTYLATLHGQPAPQVVYTYSSSLSSQFIANEVVAEWSSDFPGLNVTKTPFNPGGAFIPVGVDITPQVSRFAWLADYADPQDFVSQFYSTSGIYNIGHSSVPSADALLATADAMSDPADQASRMSRYNQAEQQLVQRVATCPTFQAQTGYLLRANIYGMRQNGQGYIADDDWTMGYRTA